MRQHDKLSLHSRENTIEIIVDFLSSLLIGIFLGFTFGVGCALAVMYSIYMGGYRAAIKDAQLPSPPERLTAARAKVLATAARTTTPRNPD
jgi:hypothetical protein